MKILPNSPIDMREYLYSEYKRLYKARKCLFCNKICKKEYRDGSNGKIGKVTKYNTWLSFTFFHCASCKVNNTQRGSEFHLDMGPTNDPHFMRFYIDNFKIEIHFDSNEVYLGDNNKNIFDTSIIIDSIDKFQFSFREPDKLYKKISTYFNFS